MKLQTPELIELYKLKPGDTVINARGVSEWEITNLVMVYDPGQTLTVNEVGMVIEDDSVRKVPRLRFQTRCAWYGYIFPHDGTVMAIDYHGHPGKERVVWKEKLPAAVMTVAGPPPANFCECAM